jgi:hypothetical protein
MSDDLLPGEHAMPITNTVLTSRGWAANILREVADYTDHGSWPDSVSAFDFGRAIGRALTNNNESNSYLQMLNGYHRYLRGKR